MPKVSVVIPVYGVEKYIERCARSLFEQTLDDIEFIFVDDCTPDRSMETLARVIEEYRLRFAEMNYLVRTEKMPTNSGLPAVRRHGIQLCTGDYIIHCDSDDWIDVSMLGKMYNYAIQNDCDIVTCDFYRTDGATYKSKSHVISDEVYQDKISVISHMLIGFDLTSLCTKIARKDLYQNVDYPMYNMQEDAFLSLQLYYNARKIGHIPEYLYYYYHNPLSISRQPTVGAYLNRLHQVSSNTDGMIGFAKHNNIYNLLTEEFECQKLRARNHIVDLANISEYYKLWRNTYPEIDKTILKNKKINKKERRQYILVRLRVYHILLHILKSLKIKRDK